MLHRIINFFTSLRLTVVLLCLALILVFIGTMAQEPLGLYIVQDKLFRSWFVDAAPMWAGIKKALTMIWIPLEPSTPSEVLHSAHIPVFPGGWLLGYLLLVNLIAAHIKRFKFNWKKSGIFLTHIGLIFLLMGQFLTEVFQTESTMRLEPNETKNYSDDSRHNELAVIDTTNPDRDDVVVIPESMIAKKGEINHPSLPFTIRVKNYFLNSEPAGPMSAGENKIKATEGIGKRLLFTQLATATSMNDENKPTALVEIVAPDKHSLGEWTVSNWLTKYPWIHNMRGQFGKLLGGELDAPQSFTYNGHTYEIALRPIRYYKPFNLTLLKFQHDSYKGTDIPKNFASRVHLNNPSRGEDRDVLIYMNNPLRYGGETYYQASFERGDVVTILQVVNNPAAATPYVSCFLVGFGLIIQFLIHLVGFARKRKEPSAPLPKPSRQTTVAPVATKNTRSS
ncbi:MAG: hypothetical protein JWM68_5424 [Verrucomicrobiales bacterium]|nr:hypothetical protein [Verrucomicrobiales bacterium]